MPYEVKKTPLTETELAEQLYYNSVASASECTGLIPSQPESDEQAESYGEIYSIPRQMTEQDTEPKHQ